MGKKIYVKDKKTGKFRGSIGDSMGVPRLTPIAPPIPETIQTKTQSPLSANSLATREPYASVIVPKVSLIAPIKGESFQMWVEKNIDKAWQVNRKLVLQNLSNHSLEELEEVDPQLVKRLSSHGKKYGYSSEEVYNQARSNKYFGEVFAVDPKKQNIYENLAFERIKQNSSVSSLIKPPGGGVDSIVVEESTGLLTTRGKLQESGREGSETTKSVDFVWLAHNTLFVASHKYTQESGGGQNHQRDDLAKFLNAVPEKTQYASPSSILYHHTDDTPRAVVFIAFADGPYYKEASTGAGTKLDQLKARSEGHNKHVISMDSLPDLIAAIGRKNKQGKGLST
jgi:hypothetical protein